MNSHRLTNYMNLIADFVANRIGAANFERRYLEMFKNDNTQWSPREYEVLNDLFGAVDAFCADDNLPEPTDLNEEELRQEARAALDALTG